MTASTSPPPVRVGVAGWSLPREEQPHFPVEGTHLARYAARLPAVELNSSFYRPHRATTYARWAASVPPGFRFSVKVPRTITHDTRLFAPGPLLDAFLEGATALGDALGCLLVQLPPSLALEVAVATDFLAALRERFEGDVVLEPRHATWFTAQADTLLVERRVGRVAADPVRAPGGELPAGWPGIAYYRLHGSPRTYYSSYDTEYLVSLAEQLRVHAREGRRVWCIFDNTASGAAAGNALHLMRLLDGGRG